MAFDLYEFLNKNKFEIGTVKKEVGDTVFKGGHNDLRKTGYDVNIVDGKLDLSTHKTVMTESVNESYDPHTGLIYIGDVPFTKETIEKIGTWFKTAKKTPKFVSQFKSEPILQFHDTINGGIVNIDEDQLKFLQSMAKKHKNELASEKDF